MAFASFVVGGNEKGDRASSYLAFIRAGILIQ